MDRYVATFFHLYEHDADFRAHLEKSKGFCLPDAAMLMEKAAEFLPAKLVGPFAGLLASLTRDNLSVWKRILSGSPLSLTTVTKISPGAIPRTPWSAPSISSAAGAWAPNRIPRKNKLSAAVKTLRQLFLRLRVPGA